MGDNTTRCHRCAHCDKDWPYIVDYRQCPICGQDTYSTNTDDILSTSQAHAAIVEAQVAIREREALERKLDDIVVNQALASLDDELGSLLC